MRPGHILNLFFSFCLDSNAPVKSVHVKQRSEEGVDSEVLESIKARDTAFYNGKIIKLKKILMLLGL